MVTMKKARLVAVMLVANMLVVWGFASAASGVEPESDTRTVREFLEEGFGGEGLSWVDELPCAPVPGELDHEDFVGWCTDGAGNGYVASPLADELWTVATAERAAGPFVIPAVLAGKAVREERRVSVLADEVLGGLHGDGAARWVSLGERYDSVQAVVNERLVVERRVERVEVQAAPRLACESRPADPESGRLRPSLYCWDA